MSIREASPSGQYSTPPAGGDRRAPWACRESGPPEPPKPRLFDRVRQALRARHLSRRTEEAYVAWIRRFIDVDAANPFRLSDFTQKRLEPLRRSGAWPSHSRSIE